MLEMFVTLPPPQDMLPNPEYIQIQDLPEIATAHAWAMDINVPIVILGARLDVSCTSPDVMEARLDRAASFLRIHPINPVVVTGGITQPGCQSEADVMEDGLRARGIFNRIIKEDQSDTTWSNAQNTAALLPNNKRMILISNADHLFRAQESFRSFGIETARASLFD